MDPSPEKNRAACYQGPMKLEVVKSCVVSELNKVKRVTHHANHAERQTAPYRKLTVHELWHSPVEVRKGLTATYILFEVKLLTFHWSLPKLCMQYFFTVSVVACVVFEEQWNKELSSVSSLHVQFWCHAIFNCHTVTALDHDQVL